MPRRPLVLRQRVVNDSRYKDIVVGRFLNILMKNGKKSTAERLCYGAFDIVQEKTGNDPLKVFHEALNNVKPMVEVKSRRVGGASYQVPVEIRPVRQIVPSPHLQGPDDPRIRTGRDDRALADVLRVVHLGRRHSH